jgi:hypothetical protein
MRLFLTPKAIEHATQALNRRLLGHHVFLTEERTRVRGAVAHACVDDGVVDADLLAVQLAEGVGEGFDELEENRVGRAGGGHAGGEEYL